MSTPPVELKEPEPKLPLHTTRVPPLTGSYEKAHKSYVLFSALLASWQIIGITLETKEKWGLTFKSPNAVPLVLICLVVYFGYKVTIEWMQVEEQRRHNIAAAVDFRVAHALAVVALGITLIQYLLRVQIFDVISHRVSIATIQILPQMIIVSYFSVSFGTEAYLQRWVSRSKLNPILKEGVAARNRDFRTNRFNKFAMVASGSLVVVITFWSRPGYLVLGSELLLGAVLGSIVPLLRLSLMKKKLPLFSDHIDVRRKL